MSDLLKKTTSAYDLNSIGKLKKGNQHKKTRERGNSLYDLSDVKPRSQDKSNKK